MRMHPTSGPVFIMLLIGAGCADRVADLSPRPTGWTIEEELRIGSIDGPAATTFGSVDGLFVRVDESGVMYVLDAGARTIHVYSHEGEHLRSFGRAGEGPGEMLDPIGMDWGPDGHLWVIDGGNRRYTVFDRSGDLIETHPRPVSITTTPWNGGFAGGVLYDVGSSSPGVGHHGVLGRFHTPSMRFDTAPLPNYFGEHFPVRDEDGLVRSQMRIPFTSQLLVRVDPRGYLWTASSDRIHLVKLNARGDTVAVVSRRHVPRPVSAQERSEALASLADFASMGGEVDASRIPAHKEVLVNLLVDDRGYLWTLRYTEDPQELVYSVFDHAGRYVGDLSPQIPLVHLIPGASGPVIQGNHIYGFVLDDLHVPYLVRGRIRGRS